MTDQTENIDEQLRQRWDTIYRETPLEEIRWDEGGPSPELVDLIQSDVVEKGITLDIGTGSGNNAVYLAKQGFTCYGIDISPAAIEYTRQKAAQAGVSCQLTIGNAIELPYPVNTFRFVFDRGCFPNMPVDDRERHISSVYRVLKSGGKYQLVCFSTRDHPDNGPPHPFSPDDIRRYFGYLFKIHFIKESPRERRDGVIRHTLSVLMEKS